jgi:hypothetical protein
MVVGEAGAGAEAEAGGASIPLFSSIFLFFLLLSFLPEKKKKRENFFFKRRIGFEALNQKFGSFLVPKDGRRVFLLRVHINFKTTFSVHTTQGRTPQITSL